VRLRSYLAGDVLRHTFAVSIVLLAVVITGRFVKYLAEAASGKLAAEILLPIMFYRLPGFLELLLPLALFIGILMAYGRLYVESEMVVLSDCGIGPARLASYTLLPACVIAILVAGLSLVLTPRGAEQSDALLNDPNSVQSLQLLAAGRFQPRGSDGTVTYAASIDGEDGVLYEVFAYSPDGAEGDVASSVVRAERGRIVTDLANGVRYLELEDGYRYNGSPGRADYERIAFSRYGEKLPDAPVIAKTQAVDSRATELLWGSRLAEDVAALHWRFSLIVMVPVVALLALALSKTNHRRGRYLSLAPALLLHLGYLFMLASTRSRVAEEGANVLEFWALHAAFLSLALALLFGPALRRRLRG
jgi:lipopolysaccharide export system permease protein